LRNHTSRALAEAAYVAGVGSSGTAASSALALATAVTHHDASALMLWDPVTGHHRDVVSVGYSRAALDGLGDRYAATQEHRRLRVSGAPLRMDDLPYDYRSTDMFQDVLEPAGFADGMSVCLFGDDLSYRGMLHLSASSRGAFDDEALQFIDALAPVLARVCGAALAEPLNGEPAQDVRVSILDEQGIASAVYPHQVARVVLEPGFDTFIRRFRATAVTTAQGLWPMSEGWLSVELYKLGDVPTAGPVPVRIEERATKPAFGLSPREIDILQGIARGYSNQEIARSRGISLRTVTTHVERILQKTDQRSRSGVVSIAARHGLLLLDL
jgi:DNA-binding CsgD family transcriptional regulator